MSVGPRDWTDSVKGMGSDGSLPISARAVWVFLSAVFLSIGLSNADATNSVTLNPVTNNAEITWLWSTQHLVQASAGMGGSVSGNVDDWMEQGSNATLAATASNGYRFAGWTGVPGDTNANPATFVVGTEYTNARAWFVAEPSAFQLWLAAHNLPTDGSADHIHSDDDGMDNWQEYLADTDPTDDDSRLEITGLQTTPLGLQIDWKGGTGVWQYLESRGDLLSTVEQWKAIFSNPPPTPLSTNVIDASATSPLQFYRIKAVR